MRSVSEPQAPLPHTAGLRPQLVGPVSRPFSFLGGGPPVCPPFVPTPLPMTSITLLANSSVMSTGRGCPPSFLNRQSRNVHLPRMLDQQRNGRPVACTYFGSVGRSVCPFPATARISAKCTLPFVRSRYPCMSALSFGLRSSFHPMRQLRGACCPPGWN
jgi:hypothetical protein